MLKVVAYGLMSETSPEFLDLIACLVAHVGVAAANELHRHPIQFLEIVTGVCDLEYGSRTL